MNPWTLLIDVIVALAGGLLLLGTCVFWVLLHGATDTDLKARTHERIG